MRRSRVLTSVLIVALFACLANVAYLWAAPPAVPATTLNNLGINIPYVISQTGYSVGANEVISALRAASFITLDTGQGAYELYAMNQDVETTDAVVFATVDTGQGANEVYAMDQDVDSTADPVFASVDADLYRLSTGDVTDILEYPQTEASYIIWVDNSTGTPAYYAKSGVDGSVTNNGNITALVDTFLAENTSFYFKYANYTFTTKLYIYHLNNIRIDADPGTVFTGAILPILEWAGNGMDGQGHGGGGAGEPVYRGFSLSNINFVYTGAVATGSVVYIHELQNDKVYQGGFYLNNVNIRSTQVVVPTDLTFIGLNLEDCIGLELNYCNINYFGTGYKYTYTIWQGSHNIFNNLFISRCKGGINDSGSQTAVTYNGYKATDITGWAYSSGAVTQNVLFINPQIEISTNGMTFGSKTIKIVNGIFSFVTSYVIDIAPTAANKDPSLIVENSWFGNSGFCINTKRQTWLIGNSYYTCTNIVTESGAFGKIYGYDPVFITENSGTASLLNGDTNVTVTHGLSYTPTAKDITITFTELPTNPLTGWYVGAINSTAFVFFGNDPGASNLDFSWHAIRTP